MDKLTRLFFRRLRQDARRQTLRNALLNGLLELKLIEHNGVIARHYSPAFDTSLLTGDVEPDLAFVRRHFGAFLIEPPKMPDEVAATVGSREITQINVMPTLSRQTHRVFDRKLESATWDVDGKSRRAYAVRLVGMAAPSSRSAHLITAILIARAVKRTGVALLDLVKLVNSSCIVSVQSEVSGFERRFVTLLKETRLLPGAPLSLIDGGNLYHDHEIGEGHIEHGRSVVHLDAFQVSRIDSQSVRRRLVTAVSQDLPVLATADDPARIPDQVRLASDLHLAVETLDRALIATIVEAIYGAAAVRCLSEMPTKLHTKWLTMDHLILAFRPGRSPEDALRILAALAADARQTAIDDGAVDDEGDDEANEAGGDPSVENAAVEKRSSWLENRKSDGKATVKRASGIEKKKTSGGRRDVPSGAEVIQPEPLSGAGEAKVHTRLSVETLSGYGKAKDWALDLRADLADYKTEALAWADMSTRLLLSGPPGTGKTTFARALCNTLQIPLVVSSVSTWLEGGYLNDVLRKLSKTFEEARALAPCILFIDEFDGIGKRQRPEQEHADYWNAIVNKALELLDGAVKAEGVIVIGATNRPDQIDEALRRSGRLETHIEIPRPDIPALADILAFHLGSDIDKLVSAPETSQPAPSTLRDTSEAAAKPTRQAKGARS